MGDLLKIYDLIWVYIIQNPAKATEAGLVLYAQGQGYTTSDIQIVLEALYKELIIRIIIKVASFEQLLSTFNAATKEQKDRMIRDIRSALQNGTFRSNEVSSMREGLNAQLTTIIQQQQNASIARILIEESLLSSPLKSDALWVFDLGVLKLISLRSYLERAILEYR